MQYLSDTELRQRAKDIYLNIFILTEDAKIGLLSLRDGAPYWAELFTHVLEEFNLRFGRYPTGFTNGFMKEVRIPDPRSPIAAKAAEVVTRRNLRSSNYLVKYGYSRHIRTALERGAIRISPASHYDDPSLNPAVRDHELKRSIQAHPSDITIRVLDRRTMQPKEVKPIGNVTITQDSRTDYYVYCLSRCFAPRLFLDFEYDACLIINQPPRFLSRLLNQFAQVKPNWGGTSLPVTYVDPLNTKERDLNVFCCKHFCHAYQKEFRVIWLPPSPVGRLEHVDIQLGSLEDYCEIISISP